MAIIALIVFLVIALLVALYLVLAYFSVKHCNCVHNLSFIEFIDKDVSHYRCKVCGMHFKIKESEDKAVKFYGEKECP